MGIAPITHEGAPGPVPGASAHPRRAAPGRRHPVPRLRDVQPVHLYVGAVTAAGLAVIAFFVQTRDLHLPESNADAFWVFVGFVVLCELFPVSVPRRSEIEEFTTSTTFAFGLMLGWGPGRAVVALAAASAAADFLHGKQLHKTLFNVSQYALAIGAAGEVYASFGGSSALGLLEMPAMVVAAATFFLINTILPRVAILLSQQLPVVRNLFRGIGFNACLAATLLAMAPVVHVLAEARPLFLPLLALPLTAIYLATRASIRNSHLAELNRLKDDFVATVSHELRTPLTSVQGYVKTLLQLDPSLSEGERAEFLAAADRQSERLGALIEQLLVVARVESHFEQVGRSTVSIPDLVEIVVEELRARVDGHVFECWFDPDLPPVETDEWKVRQILSNLVENALKYSRPNSVITLRARRERGSILFLVEDQGLGIPPEARERIFDRFYQVDQSTTRSVGGTGLGLYICRRLSEALGGQLWLLSSSERGSSFAFRIPAGAHGELRSQPSEILAMPQDLQDLDQPLSLR